MLLGSTATNYQVFPGDRIFIDSNCLIRFDNRLAQVLNPIERILGAILLGTTTAQSFQGGFGTGTGGFVGFR